MGKLVDRPRLLRAKPRGVEVTTVRCRLPGRLRCAVAALAAAACLAGGPQQAELSLDKCRQVAARFLGVPPETLEHPDWVVLREEPSDRHPPWRVFTVPEADQTKGQAGQPRSAAVQVAVDASSGQVVSVTYFLRWRELGTKGLDEAEARALANDYMRTHWADAPESRFLRADAAYRPAAHGTAQDPSSQQFFWVVEEGGIRTGQAGVSVNLTTGRVFQYGQHYYAAKGLPPARISKQEATKKALEVLRDEQRRAKARVTDTYLATTWYKGQVRLEWVVYLQAPYSAASGSHMEPYWVHLDAHTGQVYLRIGW